MDFKRLEVFCKVYEEHSFSKTAQMMHLTQPSVSGYIASLEQELGTKLFDRQGRKVSPTKAGDIFYKYAKRLLKLKTEAENEITSLLGLKKGELKLGGSTIPGQYVLPRFLGQFKILYPNVNIYLQIGDTKQIVNLVLEDEIEIGAVGAKLNEPKLEFIPFVKDELVLAVPANHPVAKEEKTSLQMISNLPFIIREKGSGTRITMEAFLKKKGIALDSLNIVAELGSTEAVRQAIIAGIGVSILSKRAIEVETEAGLIRTFPLNDNALWRHFYLVYHKQKSLSPFAQAFLDFIKNQTKEGEQ